MTGMSQAEIVRLREVARTASAVTSLAAVIGGERWRLDDWPPEVTEFIGEFDPPTVLALLDALASRDVLLSEQGAAIALGEVVNEFSALLDSTYPPDLDDEAHRWRRVAKITEEAGEVVEALLGCVAENPRKGASHTVDDVRKELLDVAFCALAAHAHLNSNEGDALADLTSHARATHVRLRSALRSDPDEASADA